MAANGSTTAVAVTPCRVCPLLACKGLRPLEPAQTDYMQSYKQGEIAIERGGALVVQGAPRLQLFTVLSGILIRYRLLADGRRQILNFLFPGDLIGLQEAVDQPSANGLEALTASRLCTFALAGFRDLIANHPALAYDIIWLAAKEEAALEEHLVALGQRSAKERVAYLAVFLVQRAIDTGMAGPGNRVALTVTQSQIADMLGLSLVHTNRTIQTLRRSNLIHWTISEIGVEDMAAARSFAHLEPTSFSPRPFL